MKIGVFATFMSPNATPSMIKAFGQRAEGLGLESIWMGEHVALFEVAMGELVRLLESGALRPLPVNTYPLARAADAHRQIQSGRSVGKLALIPENVE